MTFNKDDEGQRQSGACEIIFGIVVVEDQPDELYGEADPEEEIELDETEKDLIVGIHGLDAAVRTKILVHLPTKFGVDLPS